MTTAESLASYRDKRCWVLCLVLRCKSAEFKRWMVNMAKKLSSVPVFLSPEYREAVVTQRTQKPHYFTEKLSPFKNDVFCFGLVLLYLASMEEPAVSAVLAWAPPIH